MLRISFERTDDLELVREIITHPEIYYEMVSDGAPDPRDYKVFPDGIYVLVRFGKLLVGMFMLVPQTSITFEIHTLFLPEGRGSIAFDAYRDGMDWLRRNTPCRKVIGWIPAYNRSALAIALRSGCTKIGVSKNSILKNGAIHDQILVGKELV